MAYFRRIDDIGRINIPKEIRRLMHIREEDNFEISINESSIIIRKREELGMIESDINDVFEAIHSRFKGKFGIIGIDNTFAVSDTVFKEKIYVPDITYNIRTKNKRRGHMLNLEKMTVYCWPIWGNNGYIGSFLYNGIPTSELSATIDTFCEYIKTNIEGR